MKQTSRTLHVSQLISARACVGQVDLFRKLFGESVEVTVELCLKHAQVFHWDWVAFKFLPETALDEYKKVQDLAWAEYEKVQGPAYTEYLKVQGSAWAEYAKVEGPALAEYKKVQGPAWVQAYLHENELDWANVHEGF